MFRLDRTFIRVAGPDARVFLQGLLTQDVEKLATAPLYAGLLSPQGKLIADMFLWPAPDGGVLIDADPARSADLLRRLTLYKLRAQVSLEDVSADYIAVVAQAPFASAAPDPRFPKGDLGWRAVLPTAQAPSALDSGYLAARIAAGAPDLAIDAATEEVFALEALFEELNGVDFQKGCFVGQENVSRMKRRGTTRRKFCPLQCEGAPAFGAPVRAGEIELGSVRSGLDGRYLALLRLDRALEAIAKGVTLSAGGLEARLDPPDWLILPGPAAGASE